LTVAATERLLDLVDADAPGRQRARVELDAGPRTSATEHLDLGDAVI